MGELNSDAKVLIRNYMLTLVVLPASLLSIIGFALGWFVNEGARGSAYAKAYGDAQTEIIKLASSAAASAANASSAELNAIKITKELDKSLKSVSTISAKAEVYGEKLNTVIKVEQGLADEVAKALLKSTDTLTLKISKEYGDRLVESESQIKTLQNKKTDSSIIAARAACYSALTGNVEHSLIMVALPSNNSDLDKVCHSVINSSWHAGGIAKGRYFAQNCGDSLDNKLYGGGYTSYVPEGYFEEDSDKYSACNSSNAFICCSPQFPN